MPKRPPLAPRMRIAFSEDGKLSESPQFEYRPQQQRMAELVSEALDESHALVCEAATGVGKSLAYLIPALTSGRRTIVATATNSTAPGDAHAPITATARIATARCRTFTPPGPRSRPPVRRMTRDDANQPAGRGACGGCADQSTCRRHNHTRSSERPATAAVW